MTKLAFENISGELFLLSDEMVKKGIEASQKSERKRIILPIHRKQDAEVQRMVNFLQPGTYIRPHMHPIPNAIESLVVIRGALRFFIFDDSGEILSVNNVSSSPLPGIIDIEPEIWHSFIVLEPDTILFECKKGPYSAATDKVFATWAPAEGSADVDEWLKLSGKTGL